MNKKFIILCIIIGFSFSLLILFIYKKNNINNVEDTKIYLLQAGAFKDYDNAVKLTKSLQTYTVIKEDMLYKVYVSVARSKTNAEKLKVFYNNMGNNIYIRVQIINDKKFNDILSKYDELISETNDKNTLLTLSRELLKKYKEME
ncbi:MAG: SPOR domain-containing protein [Bacilli bacterium]